MTKIECTFDKSSGHYVQLCREESSWAIVDPNSNIDDAAMVAKYGETWREIDHDQAPREFVTTVKFYPRCNRHAASYRKSYMYAETVAPASLYAKLGYESNLVALDRHPEIIVWLEQQAVEAVQRKEAANEQKRIRDEASKVYQTKRAQDETAEEFEVVREDEKGGLDWEATRKADSPAHLPDVPQWLVISSTTKNEVDTYNVGRKSDEPHAKYGSHNDGRVKFEELYGEFRLSVSGSSRLTLNEAKALRDALTMAIDEASK
jgi:hypothetical protein